MVDSIPPVPAVSYAALAHVDECSASAPAVTYTASAPVVEDIAPAPCVQDVEKTIEIPQLQIIEQNAEIPEVRTVQCTRTLETLGTTPVRQVEPAEVPLPSESAPPMFRRGSGSAKAPLRYARGSPQGSCSLRGGCRTCEGDSVEDKEGVHVLGAVK